MSESNISFGTIGLGVMGAALARNASRFTPIHIYNRTTSKTDRFMEKYSTEGTFIPAKTLEELIENMTGTRVLFLMVKAGPAIDKMLEIMLPLLKEGDVVIDGGNSFYEDTNRRVKHCLEYNIHFVGVGVSGGEEGALRGPSMMVGGSQEAWEKTKDVLIPMAASDGLGGNTCALMGEAGAGHFVKMTHNGIEYAIMEMLGEVYLMLRNSGMHPDDIAQVFSKFNGLEHSDLNSYLVEISADVVSRKTENGEPLIDFIVDRAKMKGTGLWTVKTALDLNVNVSTILAAVQMRQTSDTVALRDQGKSIAAVEKRTDAVEIDQLQKALELAVTIAYIQGIVLIKTASSLYNWNINMSEVARVWRAGCIIRSWPMLDALMDATTQQNVFEGLIAKWLSEEHVQALMDMSITAIRSSTPIPALSAALNYVTALQSKQLPTALIQLQRDRFGRHGFRRTDQPHETECHIDIGLD
ncbi:hypothetical protein PCE1_002249 [Barthelona sp. PCE]